MNHMRRKNTRAHSPSQAGTSRRSSFTSEASHRTCQTDIDDGGDIEAHLGQNYRDRNNQ